MNKIKYINRNSIKQYKINKKEKHSKVNLIF